MSIYLNNKVSSSEGNLSYSTSSPKVAGEHHQAIDKIKKTAALNIVEQASSNSSMDEKEITIANSSQIDSPVEAGQESTVETLHSELLWQTRLENAPNEAKRITAALIQKFPSLLNKMTSEELEEKMAVQLVQTYQLQKEGASGFIVGDQPFPLLLFKDKEEFIFLLETDVSSKQASKDKIFSRAVLYKNGQIDFKAALITVNAKNFFRHAKIDPVKSDPYPMHILPRTEYTHHDENRNQTLFIYPLYDGDLTRLRSDDEIGFEAKRKITRKAAKGVAELHEQGLVHRDIKPGNFFIKQTDGGKYNVVVGDLDYAVPVGTKFDLKNYVITLGYVAPEISTRGNPSTQGDVYSLGRTLENIFDHEISTNEEVPIKDEKVVEVTRLVERAKSKNPTERPTAREIADILKKLKQ